MDHLLEIENILQKYCREKAVAAKDIDKRYAELWEIIATYLAGGGKRMRPQLVKLAYDAYRSSSEIYILPVAAAWEMLHACLLVHDDIIDRDTVRHGQPNIAGRYETIYEKLTTSDISHYALSAALLGGDLLLVSTYELVNSSNISSDQKLLVHSYLNKAFFAVAGGELIDTDAVLFPVSESNPYAVATHKTASYSLQLPLQCGAALAGAPKEELDKLSKIGLHLGVAYQLRDDLLGVFGDSKITGKSNRSDIFEKKRTALIQAALLGLDEAEADALNAIFAPDHIPDQNEVEYAVELISKSGAKEEIENTVGTETQKALEEIARLSVSDDYKTKFSAIADKLMSRSH